MVRSFTGALEGLQWSLTPKSEDGGSYVRFSSESATCFNGASLRRVRMAGDTRTAPTPGALLQWSLTPKSEDGDAVGAGRGGQRGSFNGASLRRVRMAYGVTAAFACKASASMEPHSEE